MTELAQPVTLAPTQQGTRQRVRPRVLVRVRGEGAEGV